MAVKFVGDLERGEEPEKSARIMFQIFNSPAAVVTWEVENGQAWHI